jgi:hypothetical protein
LRIRSIKPDFYQDEELAALPPLVRILYTGLWCLADRSGRLEDRPVRIKVAVLPYDNLDVEAALDQLDAAGFIQRYRVGDKAYIQVRTFEKHQRPHHREPPSVLPAPSKSKPGGKGRARPGQGKASPARKGMEGKGMEGVPAAPSMALAGVVSWSSQAYDDWRDGTGGEPKGGRIGKALKPLIERIARKNAVEFDEAWQKLRPWWRKFCDGENSRYGPEWFVTNPRAAVGLTDASKDRGVAAMLDALEAGA